MIVYHDDISVDDRLLPVIGWDNQVTINNISAQSEEDGFPATNMANPSTNNYWLSENVGQYLTINLDVDRVTSYVAFAEHNFDTVDLYLNAYFVPDDFVAALLHFDSDQDATFFYDEAQKNWTAAGGAKIDQSWQAFGGGSAFFDGTGDYITTPDDGDFTIGSGDMTVSFVALPNVNGTALRLCGQASSSGLGNANTAWAIYRNSDNTVSFTVVTGTTQTTVTSTSTLTTGNQRRIDAVKVSGVLKLFIDGVQEGGNVAHASSINDSSAALGIGCAGDLVSTPWNGWIDEFQFSVGVARNTVDFTPSTEVFGVSTMSVVGGDIDDGPLILWFPPRQYSSIRIYIDPGDEWYYANVMYAGDLLIFERSISLDPKFTPLRWGRRANIATGMSETGNFLGRIVVGEFKESGIHFSNMDQEWFRENVRPFLRQAHEFPFFLAWYPEDHPEDTGYAWLMDDPKPEIDPVTQLVDISLAYRGITN